MRTIILPNGLKVVYVKRNNKSVAVQVLVRVGSNNETKEQAGYSHFLEHMLFEGTKKRKDSQIIANEIESVGGHFNAYTTNERTCFYIKVPNKYAERAIDILSDMMQHSTFEEHALRKEKKVVVKEIDMVNDDPRNYQWTFFHQHFFQKHPSKNPVYGNRRSILTMKRDDIIDYYKKYYNPKNMVLVIVGNIGNWKQLARKYFTFTGGRAHRIAKVNEPSLKRNKEVKVKKNIISSYLVLGYHTVPRKHQDSYVLDVINAILGRGQSGWMFNQIRGKNGLAYEVGTEHIAELQFGYLAVHVSASKSKIPTVKALILNQLQRLQQVTERELHEAKEYLEGNFLLANEDNQKFADTLCYAESTQSEGFTTKYITNIKRVTRDDVLRAYKKYFEKPYCMTVLEGK
jgi:predicted Zn-dependent peptidase